jgi:hypothetical protein
LLSFSILSLLGESLCFDEPSRPTLTLSLLGATQFSNATNQLAQQGFQKAKSLLL